MNYYDELGVSRDASERELRQAYRVLVRLLHPDTQTGDDLRLAAERQLSRLNEMLAVLTNGDSRRAYDLSLEQGRGRRHLSVPPQPTGSRRERQTGRSAVAREASRVAQIALRYWAMILIGLVVIGAIALSSLLHGTSESSAELQAAGIQGPSPPPVARKIVARQPQAQPPLSKLVNDHQPAPALVSGTRRSGAPDSKVSSVETSLPAVVAPVALPGAFPVPTQAGEDSEPVTKAKETVPQRPAQARLSVASSPPSSFSGNWLYTTDLAAPQESDGYRAIYVELLLLEKDGGLSGNYRARYVVPDKAISPQVSFQLQGRASSDRGARVKWSAPNGARGEAELSLGATGIMDFRWWSTESGGQSGLSSGTAKLVRQRTP